MKLFYTFTINGPLQQQQNPIKCRSIALFVENDAWKAFRRTKVLDYRVPFARKLIQIRQPPIFKKWAGFWFDFCFTALRHILGHFGRGQLTKPHCSWASLLGSLPVLSAHCFASNWQLLFLNQRKRENGRRNVFMTKSPRKNVPDVGIELGAACMPSELASDRATAPSGRGNSTCHVLS